MDRITRCIGDMSVFPSDDDILKILVTDGINNYTDMDHNPSEVFDNLSLWVDHNRNICFSEKVITILSCDDDSRIIEFHCMNGGSAKDLSKHLSHLFEKLSTEFDTAVTYYDNPRIGELAHHVGLPVTITRINEGRDRTFIAQFDIRK